MKRKTFLSLLEQICMIAVFTLVSAICIQAFFGANTLSKERRNLDNATIVSQNAAEILKQSRGNTDAVAELLSGVASEEEVTVKYNAEWIPVQEENEAEFLLQLQIEETEDPLLGKALILVCDKCDKNKIIFSLHVAWQEVQDEV